MPTSVIAIFDIGKTNKKLFLFNEQYQLVHEDSVVLKEVLDEDNEPCEDLSALTEWVLQSWQKVLENKQFDIKAVNFSTYGASFVYIDKDGKPLTPLYNYLKKYPERLLEKFYHQYGGKEKFSVETASPVLGSLNSGMQLYRLKYEQPHVYAETKFALHLPQYISYLISHHTATDLTSIGCHTNLWDFTSGSYHRWVKEEGVLEKFAPIGSAKKATEVNINDRRIQAGIGLHDSSSALIPYLINFHEPFILLSTGTWCISLNPFNEEPLTTEELEQDCLCYISYQSKPVKASRLFAGYEHEETVKKLAAHFNKPVDYYQTIAFDPKYIQSLPEPSTEEVLVGVNASAFSHRALSSFESYEQAYHVLLWDIVHQQRYSTSLVLSKDVTRIFVDGGFGKNTIYMNLLAAAFSNIEVYASSIPQSTARGAALVLHDSWNKKPIPADLIELRQFSFAPTI